MKKFLFVSLVLILSFSLIGCSSATDEELANEGKKVEGEYQEGQLVVSLHQQSNLGTQSVDNLVTSQVKDDKESIDQDGFRVVDSIFDFNGSGEVNTLSTELKTEVVKTMGFVYVVEYDLNDYKSHSEAKSALEDKLAQAGKKVKYIEPNFTYKAIGAERIPEIPTDDKVSVQQDMTAQMNNQQSWHYEMINAPKTWENGTTGSDAVRVAILDTGIDYDHESLAEFVNTDLGKSFVSNTFNDGNGHGTHVAGTIASTGSVSGVMQEADLIPVKVLSDEGSGSLSAIQKGILYAADQGADVVNMSIGGGGYSQAMADACQTAVNRGTVVIAASGNESNSSVSYPSRYDSVISVGAVDSNKQKANFSNYGSELDVVAPGVNIYSTYYGNRYNKLSGTSMASPHVAGVAGLMRSANRDISVNEVRSALINTAEDAGNSNYYGAGIVDAYRAVAEVDNGDDGDDGDDNDPDPEPEPDPDPTPSGNLALNKPISASGTYQSYEATNANDGNAEDTFWATNAGYYSDWLMVDLEEKREVSRAKVKWSANNYATHYTIYYYNNGWKSVAATSNGDGNWDEVEFSQPVTGRYFYLRAQRNNSNYYTVYEFELYKN
jgi:subtilisin family serine protease